MDAGFYLEWKQNMYEATYFKIFSNKQWVFFKL